MYTKIANSLHRKFSGRYSLRKISRNPQSNGGVVNLHRLNPGNVGDYYCAPHHYFDNLQNTGVDIFKYRETNAELLNKFVQDISHNSLIIGGGGLLNRGSFEKPLQTIQELSKKGKKTVLWGIGHNSKKSSDYKKLTSYNIDISSFGLVGTRDYTAPGRFVPCVSCMHPVFARNYRVKHELGIIFHHKSLKDAELMKRFGEFPSTANNENIEELAKFIGSCDHIITNSYHAMYWGILLQKKVTVVPNSSKFFDFKYQPNFSTFEGALKEFKKARAYSGVLEECITINQRFFKDVKNYMELESE